MECGCTAHEYTYVYTSTLYTRCRCRPGVSRARVRAYPTLVCVCFRGARRLVCAFIRQCVCARARCVGDSERKRLVRTAAVPWLAFHYHCSSVYSHHTHTHTHTIYTCTQKHSHSHTRTSRSDPVGPRQTHRYLFDRPLARPRPRPVSVRERSYRVSTDAAGPTNPVRSSPIRHRFSFRFPI